MTVPQPEKDMKLSKRLWKTFAAITLIFAVVIAVAPPTNILSSAPQFFSKLNLTFAGAVVLTPLFFVTLVVTAYQFIEQQVAVRAADHARNRLPGRHPERE